MKVQPSKIPGIAICGPDTPEFAVALETILGHAPPPQLQPALPFSVVVANDSPRAIAFLGVRFDLVEARGKRSSVVHYADTLRHPESADFRPGTERFVCAEPAYTALVLRGELAVAAQGPINLDNLRRMLRIEASLDCAAFDDGEFMGSDSLGAFDRLARERELEAAFFTEALALDEQAVHAFLSQAIDQSKERAVRTAARKLMDSLESGGTEKMLVFARQYRPRIPLWRPSGYFALQ